MKKKISVSDLLAFRQCPQAYFEMVRGKRRPSTQFEVVGKVTHRLAAGGDSDDARQYVEKQLALLSSEERVVAQQDIEELTKTAGEMIDEQVTADDQELQLSWYDPETGWTIFAKPDELFYFTDSLGYKVMQITDIKTAFKLKGRHKDELFLFGLVASLALNYRYSIRLVVRLLRSKSEVTFWYSQRLTEQKLDELRETFRSLEAAWKAREFPGCGAWYCRTCNPEPAAETVPAASAAQPQDLQLETA